MAVVTVAQLVAEISANTSGLETRLKSVEDALKVTQKQVETVGTAFDRSANSAAASVAKVTDALKNEQRALDNTAKFEYQTQQKSAADYKTYLADRIKSVQSYSSEYTRLTGQYVAVEKKMLADTVAATNKANADKIASTKQYQSSLASLAKFEYEQGNLSTQAYQEFLRRRMAAYGEYTAEWKSAASQLSAIDSGLQREQAAQNKVFLSEKKAEQEAYNSWKITSIKEVQAAELEAVKAGQAAQTAAIKEARAGQAEASSARSKTSSAVFGALGTGAAGITAVEGASALFSANFNHNLIGEANNTLMSSAQIGDMRKAVLDLNKQTGQDTRDLETSYRWVSDFAKSTDTATDKLKILTEANKEAVGTMSETGPIARSLASSLSIFGAGANEAAGYVDVLHHSAAAGALTVQQFAEAGGPALAIAAAMGDKFYDAATAISFLTKKGFDAAEAATQIKSLVAHIGDPTNEATKNIAAIQAAFQKKNPNSNINLLEDFSQKGIEEKGLVGPNGILKDLLTVTGGDASLIAKLIPALRGGIGGTTLAQASKGGELDNLYNANKSLQQGNTGSETKTVFDRMMEDSQQKFRIFTAKLQQDFLPVGEQALKIFESWEPAIMRGTKLVLDITTAFQKLPAPIQSAITAFGGLMILNKFTGILEALKIPTALGTGLKTLIEGFGNLGKGTAFLEGTPLAAVLARWATGFGAAGEAGVGLAAVLTGPVGLAIVGTVAAIAGLAVAWSRDWGHIREVTKSSTDDISVGFRGLSIIASDSANYSVSGWKEAGKELSDEFAGIKKGADGTWSEMVKGIKDTGPQLVAGLNLDPVIDKFAKAWDSVEKTFNTWSSTFSIVMQTWWDNTPLAKYLSTVAQRAGANDTGSINTSNSWTTNIPSGWTNSTTVQGGPLGSKAALAVDVETSNKAATDCEHRARVIIQSATSAFDDLFQTQDASGRITAKSVAGAMLQQGLLQKYTPGMQLKPGDLLYSMSLGNKKDTGHVSAIDSHLNRRDQYGANHFAASSYQYVFDPDYALAKRNNAPYAGENGPVAKPVTAADIANEQAAQKQAKADAKAAELAAKQLQRSYIDHLQTLQKIVAVKRQSTDLDRTSEHHAATAYDISRGELVDLSAKKKATLLSAADAADTAEQLQKVNNLLGNINAKIREARLSPAIRQALENTGLTEQQWESLGKMGHGAQTRVLDASNNLELGKVAAQARTGQLEDQYAPTLDAPGNLALKNAVQAAGGIEKWLGLGIRPSTMGPFNINGRSDAQNNYLGTTQAKITSDVGKNFNEISKAQANAAKAFEDNDKKSLDYDPRAEAIDKFNQQYQKQIELVNELSGANKTLALARLEAERSKAGDEGTKEYLTSTTRKLEGETRNLTGQSDAKLAAFNDRYLSNADQAVDKWISENKKMIQVLGTTSDAVVDYKNAIRGDANQDNFIKGQLTMSGLYDDLTKQALLLSGHNPFETWLNGFKELREVVQADGQTTLQYVLPTGMDVARMHEIFDLQQKMARQAEVRDMIGQGTQALSSGVIVGLKNAFSPDASARGNMQTQLYQQQQEQLQYQVAEQEFKSKYPGDPNDPYIDRLKNIQQQIDVTKNKLAGIGNTLTSVFSRLFGGIYDQFKQTITKMAESYLQSQLLKYLNKQVGTGSGPVSGQGGSGFVGTLAGVVSAGLSIASSLGVGGANPNSALPAATSTWAATGTMLPDTFAGGGRFNGNKPIIVGENGPEIIMPDAPGNVIPNARAVAGLNGPDSSRGRTGKSATTVINNWNITTPDVQGFRQSRASMQQDMRKMITAGSRR